MISHDDLILKNSAFNSLEEFHRSLHGMLERVIDLHLNNMACQPFLVAIEMAKFSAMGCGLVLKKSNAPVETVEMAKDAINMVLQKAYEQGD